MYELLHAVWRADAILFHGADFQGWPPTTAILDYIRNLELRLRALQALL